MTASARRRIKRIEIAGGIAAGKTTLARVLTAAGLMPVHEQFRRNPFYEAFYRNPSYTAFETEVTFLLLHYHLQRMAVLSDRSYCADFSSVLDHAYAQVTLARNDLFLFEAILQRTEAKLAGRTALIVLQCPAEVELRRILNRRRKAEKAISIGYLQKINDALEARVATLPKAATVLRIDSAKTNFVRDHEAIRDVVRQVKSII